MVVRFRISLPTLLIAIAASVVNNAVRVQAQAASGNLTSDDLTNPTFGANLVHFQISTTDSAVSSLTCNNLGARCVFRKDYYTDYDFGGGQETANTQGAVWAYTVAGTVLTLEACTGSSDANRNDCIVTCNANCTCSVVSDEEGEGEEDSGTTATTRQADGETASTPAAANAQSCTKVTSRAPTMAPKTNPPVGEVCTNTQFETNCGALMLTLPPGIEQNYDCFNFCGGAWMSSCAFGQTCNSAELDCANKTAVGTQNGQVFGCTNEHLAAAKMANMTNGTKGGTSSATAKLVLPTTWSFAVLGGLVAVLSHLLL